jgi:LacI family transcriptional regulator
MRTPTLRKIAAACGVNVSTVSRALNNSSKIAPETREAILKKARELGWKPNPLASAYMSHLRSGREPTHQGNLAFLVAFREIKTGGELPEYHKLVFAGAKARAESQGFSIEPIWLRDVGFDMVRLSKLLKNRGVMGVILHGGDLKDDDFARFDWNSFALATWGFSLQKPLIHRAAYHMAHGMRLAHSKIRSFGYTRIALAMAERQNELTDHAAPSYFHDGQLKSKYPRLIKLYDGYTTEAQKELQRWLLKIKPEVVVGDEWVWNAIQGTKMRIPDDVAFVSPHWSSEWPLLAGIDHLPYVIGTNVVDLVTGQIIRNERGIPSIPKLLYNEGVWRDGATLPAKRKS